MEEVGAEEAPAGGVIVKSGVLPIDSIDVGHFEPSPGKPGAVQRVVRRKWGQRCAIYSLRMQIEPHWMSYVAIATGIIGAITGIAGSIMGYIAYRRSNEIKRSDRRLNLHKLRNDVDIAGATLHDLLPEALESRKMMMHARGILHTGAMRRYTDEHTMDLKRATELSSRIPPEDVNYDSMSLQQLEQALVQLDRTKGQVNRLIDKYRDSIREDGK